MRRIDPERVCTHRLERGTTMVLKLVPHQHWVVAHCSVGLLFDVLEDFMCPSMGEKVKMIFVHTVKSFWWSPLRDTDPDSLCLWPCFATKLRDSCSGKDYPGLAYRFFLLFVSFHFSSRWQYNLKVKNFLYHSMDSKKCIL